MARISPAFALKLISSSATANAVDFGRCNFVMRHTGGVSAGSESFAGSLRRLISATSLPTISSANWRLLLPLVSIVPTFRPRRNTVARLVKARISSSLCEINNTAMPLSANRRNTANSWLVSCGVRTDVGSSIISKDGFCSRHRITSTRCCWPTDRS